MVFRPRSVTSKTNKLYEELKLTGFTWFGGQGDGVASANDSSEHDPESAPGAGTQPEELNYHAGMTSASVRKRPAGSSVAQGVK